MADVKESGAQAVVFEKQKLVLLEVSIHKKILFDVLIKPRKRGPRKTVEGHEVKLSFMPMELNGRCSDGLFVASANGNVMLAIEKALQSAFRHHQFEVPDRSLLTPDSGVVPGKGKNVLVRLGMINGGPCHVEQGQDETTTLAIGLAVLYAKRFGVELEFSPRH